MSRRRKNHAQELQRQEKGRRRRQRLNSRRHKAEEAERILQSNGQQSYLDRVAKDLYGIRRHFGESDASLIARLQSFGPNRFAR